MRFLFTAAAVSVLSLSSSAIAQERYATFDFTVEIDGHHRADLKDGNYKDISKKRLYRGKGRLKYLGHSNLDEAAAARLQPKFEQAEAQVQARVRALSPQHIQNGQNVAAAMAKCADLEDAAMQRCAMDVANRMSDSLPKVDPVADMTEETAAIFSGDQDFWGADQCSAHATIDDKGEYYIALDAQEGIITQSGKIPYALVLDAPVPLERDCNFSIKVDKKSGKAEVTLEVTPHVITAKETFGSTTRTTGIDPVGWSSAALRPLKLSGLKIQSGKSLSGTWTKSDGKPSDLSANPTQNVARETYDSVTKASWTINLP